MERMAIGAAEISFKMLVSVLKFDSIKLNSGEPIKVMLKATLSLKNLVQHLWKSGLNKEVDGFIDKSVNKEVDGFIDKSVPSISLPEPAILFSPRPVSELDAAAVKLQKFYKSYRTRRNLADCAVVVEELWWKALHFAALEQSSVSSFDVETHETAGSRWARARTRATKVGKGLSKDEKAQKLALRHWLEAIDPRHRYGHNLHLYYDIWFQSESTQPFFYWLDVGDGKEVSLDSCSRIRLQRQCIKYLGPKERGAYEVIVENGKLVYRQTGLFIETTEASKWIFVLSTSRNLYVGQKKKGVFHHSSFLSGGAIIAAGRLVAHDGVLEAIWPYSAQYQTVENFEEIISFLQEHNVDLTNVKVDWDLCEGRTAGLSQPSNSPSTRIKINTTGQETSKSASSSRWPVGLLDGGNVIQPDPLEQSTENVAHAAKADLCLPTVSPPNNKMARKSFKTKWRTMSLVFEDHQQHFGRKCEGTAKSLGVTRISMKHGINRASTVDHILKPHGIHWWLFRQKWARRKGYSLGGERTFDVSCLSVDDIFDSRLLFIHRPQFARSSPQILALPDGGKIVGPIALSSSELDATNNRAHHVRRDQSGSTTSHHEWKNTRERSDRQGIAMSLCSVKDLQKHFVCKHKDVVKRLGVNIPMFKSTCRQHRIYWQRCRIKNKANCICEQHGISLVPIVKCIRRQHGFHRFPFRQGNSLGGERPAEVISLSTEEKLVSRLQFLHMPLLGRSSLRPLALPSGSECAEHIAFSSREFTATNNRAHPDRQDQCGSSASRLEKERTREMLYSEGIASHVFRFEYHQQHFGSTRKNDAKILGVCLSTFKRITRHRGIRRWPNRIRNNVWRSPGPHQEKNLSPTFKTLSTNGQITMENDMGCQNLEQNELLPDSFEDLNFWNRANSSRAEIGKTPTFHDSFSGNCCDADICFSSEYDKTEAAGGSFKWAFQLEGLTTQFTANRNLNTLFCPQPQIASTEVLSENMGSSEDWRKLLASQAEGFLKGYVSESSNLTFSACSDASAPSQLVTTVLHTMHAIPPMIPPLTGGSSETFPFEGQSMQYPTYPNHNALQLPQPQMALTQILNEDMGSSEDWIGSQQEPFPEGHVSGSIYSKVLTCAGPSSSQLPMLTTPDTMRRIPHMMPPLTSSQYTSSVKLKATYRDAIIEFQLPLTSGIIELKEEMAMRLKLELDSFDVKYKDGEREGEWILIPWDKDLRNYLQLCSSLVNPVIRLLVVDPMGLKQPATFKESGMDPENNGIISDLLRFVSKKEIYKKAGKAWTRFYLLYEPPGADRSSLIAAMANYLEFDICDLDLTSMSSIPELENILFSTPNRSLITIQDFHHCAGMLPNLKNELTVSCLLKYVDGLFSRCGDERIIVFTTNHRDRYDAALLALVNMVFYNPTSPPQPIALPDGGETVQLGSLPQKPLVDFDAIDNREYQSGILVPNSKNNNMREASKRRRMTESVLSLVDSTTGISSRDFDPPNNGAYLVRACQSLPIMFNSEKKDTTEGFNGDFLTTRKLKREYRFISTIFDNHQQHFVKRCEGAAKSFGATHNCRKHGNSRVSTVKQIDKQHWIHRWPFRQKWATRKGYSLRDERPFEASSLSMDEELDSRFLFIHMSHFARPSPQPLALPDGGEIVGHTALSSSEFAASNNRAQLVRQDQSGSTTSRYEGKSARKTLDRQGITMSLCTAEDLQQHLGCKHKDAVKRLGVKLSMFKRTYRLHQVYCWPCRNKNNDSLAWKPFKERQELWLNMPDSLTQKSFKVVDVLPLLEQSNSIRHLVLRKRLALERWNCSGGLTPQSASLWPVGLPDGGHIVPVSKKKNVTISFKRECRTRSATFEDHNRHFGSRYKGVANNLGAKHMCKQHGINLVFTLKLIRRQHGIHRCPFRRGFSFGGERPAEVISLMEVKLVSRLQFLRISWLARSSLRPLASSRGSEIERHIAFSSSEFADTNNRAHPGRKGQRGSNSSGSHPERERTGETPYWEGIASHGIRFEHLQQRFGSKREDAARSLGISISTFKRVCRRNGIHRWPNRTKKRVLRPPDPHGENNPSPTYMTLSTIRQITVQNEMGGQNPEPNEFQLDAFVDLSLFNTERGSISDIPSDFDWTQFLANEEVPSIEGNVSGSLNSTVAACSDPAPSQQPIPTCFDPALSQQPMPTCSDPAPSQQPLPEPMPTCFDPALSQQPMPACSDPTPSQQPMPTCFDPAPSQQPRPTCSDPALSQQPMPQLIPTCFDPAPSQQPMPTCFDPALSQQPMPTFPHMMSDLAAREDTRSVVLKITYRKKILRFKFPLMSGINELKEEVKKRLKLELDSFDVEYEDEDGDSILLNCDEDLRNHLQLSSNPVIRLLVIDSDANTTDFS